MLGPSMTTRVTESLRCNTESLRSNTEPFRCNAESLRSSTESFRLNSESLGCNSESMVESPKDLTAMDFPAETFATELLESGLKEERFRIDRKKLEDMLQLQSGTSENAEDFFQRVMIETSTEISWPSKLKIGAKSKKDPHVKIIGKPDDVKCAKDRILEILDTKKNRVTLKMDVSHTDHSYIIGKGGFKIQQVMEETGCHIHFPDSNRNSTAEKSNQVSIAGQAIGVEAARVKIRDLLPLVFMFELPNGDSVTPGEECSPAIQHIQQTYSFNVAFKPIGPLGLGRTLLVVRGCQRLLPRLRQGLALLMEYLTGSKVIPVMGFMKTEIAAQHHQFVMGACNANTQMITNKTGATIIFPDSSLAFGDSAQGLVFGQSILRSKSTVLIQGSFDSVCLAWQELLKCLPLVMMFDLREGQELDPVMVVHLMETFNINIMVRPKTKENTKSVLVRGAEKDSEVLFQVRKEILGLEDDICASETSSQLDSVSAFVPRAEQYSHQPVGHIQFHSRSEEKTKRHSVGEGSTLSTAESISLLTNIIQRNPQIIGLLNNLSSAFPPVVTNAQSPPVQNAVRKSDSSSSVASATVGNAKDVESWISSQRFPNPVLLGQRNYNKNDRQMASDDIDSGIFLPSHSRLMKNGFESRSDLSSQPESSASSTASNDAFESKNRFFRKTSQSNEQSAQASADFHELLVEYENKKLNATKAMYQPVGDGIRTPTPSWSGYGFSKSMPDFALKAKLSAQSVSSPNFSETEKTKPPGLNLPSKTWNTNLMSGVERCDSPHDQVSSPFSMSNFWESIPQQPSVNFGSIRDREQLFSLLGLEKYNDIFSHHEIDFPTFLTLTDTDLQQLNISYAARRRMLAIIAAICEQNSNDRSAQSFHAAPGAERRAAFARFSTSNSVSDETAID